MVCTCKACKLHEKLRESAPLEYGVRRASHSCPRDYTDSTPSMECVGAKRIFNKSMERNGLRYTEFYGDGDSKSFSQGKMATTCDSITGRPFSTSHIVGFTHQKEVNHV